MPKRRSPRNRPETPRGEEAPEIPATCPIDGASLDYRGFCELGNGYPDSMKCPFVCPKCRKRLSWSGACFSCFGAETARRADWTMPGDRYEFLGRHWTLVSGPLPVVSPEDAEGLAENIRAILDRRITPEQGRLRAQVILAKYPERAAPASQAVPF